SQEAAAEGRAARSERPAARSERRSRERARSVRDSKETRDSRESRDSKASAERARDTCMDEIACELAPSPPACCSRYKSQRGGSEWLLDQGDRKSGSRAPSLPERLDRSAISAGMSKVHGSVSSCRAGALASGTVSVSVKVAASGEVDSVQ